MEIRPIPGFGGNYAVTSTGDVYRVKKSRNSKPWPLKTSISKGYHRVNLCHEGVIRHASVHRLVGYAFLGLTDELVINHKNGITTDNRVENLEVCTISQNILHSVRVLKTWKSPTTKLTESDVLEIRRLHKDGVARKVIAQMFPVNLQSICKIVNRQSWTHI